MSSHREAPQIAKDPVADSTDVYAFVSPDDPETVTLIANYIPLQLPDGGPNFYEFGDDVLYTINVDNTGDGHPDIRFRFRFSTKNTIPSSFLYNDGPIESLTSTNWNRRQTYDLSVETFTDGRPGPVRTIAEGLTCPPCNVGPLSTPDYTKLATEAIHGFNRQGFSGKVFAGQRAEGFYVDLGSVFDLGNLRPFQADHTTFGLANTGIGKMAAGVNSTANLNVHSLALQIPITQLTNGKSKPASTTSSNAVIGVWTAAYRRTASVNKGDGHYDNTGAFVQVSRLGNPLINEVLIPLGSKDAWNTKAPSGDASFAANYTNPLLAQLLPDLYPGVFPNLAKYNAASPNRADLEAILLVGIPAGVIASTYTTQIGSSPKPADMLRLNVAIPPASSSTRNNLGALGGDIAGFPNGRRVFDDVATIELRAVAGATLPLVDKSFTADAAAGEVSFGLTTGGTNLDAKGTEKYLSSFPYLGTPLSGYDVKQIAVS